MNSHSFDRKLAAILHADVADYSRLTGDDEEGTHLRLTEYLDLIADSIRRHRGSVVHYAGDAVLADFDTVTDAVTCAAAIQRELSGRNATLRPRQKVQFRIGVNLGEVIVDRNDIYGDGVNVAARLEGLAAPGGICVSESVVSAIGNKLPLDYEFMGEQAVKNIAKPVKAYHARMKPGARLPTPRGARREAKRTRRLVAAGVAAALVVVIGGLGWLVSREAREGPAPAERAVHQLPDKPSIAVLPFTNMSGDEGQEYFADGITDDLITDLSRISGLFVVARTSAFAYKGKAMDVAEVGRELGVRYVLEGSVRRTDEPVRITAQLVDAVTNGHVWAERYDRDLKDVFALQDEVTSEIVRALAVTLTRDEQERLVHRYTNSIEAYDYYLRGLEYFGDPTREANVLARRMHEKAIELDPEFAAAYAFLGFTYSQEWTMGWSQDPRSLERAFDLAETAIDLDEWLPYGYAILAEVYLWKKEHERAIAAQERAIALSPNDADQIAGLGGILIWAGRPDRAIELVRKAMRLNPMYPIEYLWNLGHASFVLGDHADAIEALSRLLDRNPDYLPAHAYLGAIYSELGRDEEARTEAAELQRLSPGASLDTWRQRLPYRDRAVLERLVSSLRKAGLR